jgi:hypothetical protein
MTVARFPKTGISRIARVRLRSRDGSAATPRLVHTTPWQKYLERLRRLVRDT